jgi:hypothetical protein
LALALDTVADYVTQARVLLQDTVGPTYRYPDTDLVFALNMGITRARQLRADLFIATDGVLPYYTVNDGTSVLFEPMYRQGLLQYVVGYVQSRDAEDTTDDRASGFMNAFIVQLEMGSGTGVAE